VHWQRFASRPEPARLEVELAVDGKARRRLSFPLEVRSFPFHGQITLPADHRPGLHTVTARLLVGRALHARYRTGYWLRDQAALRSGPRVGLSRDYFTLNGRTQLIAGTTYMA